MGQLDIHSLGDLHPSVFQSRGVSQVKSAQQGGSSTLDLVTL